MEDAAEGRIGDWGEAVSYTHLDVYKRQEIRNVTTQTKKIMELAGLGRIAIINERKE